jgi:hypothetical protein
MYADAKTWNPFVGCLHGCVYCEVSFQKQLKRWAKKHCEQCYRFTPHTHPERLNKIPSSKIVFVCGDGDIAFCPTLYLQKIVEAIAEHNLRCPHKTYYFQSKNWDSARRVIPLLEEYGIRNATILETLETNRDEGYTQISKAPSPTLRHKTFLQLNYSRKVITVEPILDFDLNPFYEMIVEAEPEYVWLGYNSKPNLINLPEPSVKKVNQLIKQLESSGIQVRVKKLSSETNEQLRCEEVRW